MWIWLLVLGERWELDFRWVQARDGFRRHFGSVYQISRVWKKLVRPVFFPDHHRMDVFQAKLVAAATGSTLTALTSPYFIYIYFVMKFLTPLQ